MPTTIRNGAVPFPPADFHEALPLAAVAASGEVIHVNDAGRGCWGHIVGLRLPADVVEAMRTRGSGAVEPLPVPIGGHRVLCAPGPEGGWVLVGYTDTGVWEAEAPGALDALVETAPVALFRLRADGVVLYASPEAEVVTGRAAVSMSGRPFLKEVLHPEDRGRFDTALRQALREGSGHARARFERADGAIRRAEVRLRHDGHPHELTAALLDVTEHDEVASALLQSEALYQTFLEQSPVGIFHLDAEGVVTFENHCLRQLTGEEPEDAWIGRRLEEIVHLDARLGELTGEMLARGQAFDEHGLAFTRPDGDRRTLTVHGAPILHPEHGTVGAAVMVFDVTDERERELELRTLRRYDDAEPALRNAALTHASEHAFLDEAVRILGETAGADRAFVLLPAEDADAYEEEVRWAREPERSLVPLRVEGRSGALFAGLQPGTLSHLRGESARGPAATLLDALGAPEAVAFSFSARGGEGILLLTRSSGEGRWLAAERRALAPLAGLFETLWGWMRAEARYREVVTTIEDGLFAFGFDEGENRCFSFATRQVEALTGRPTAELLGGGVAWGEEVVHPEDRAALQSHERMLREGRESRLSYRIVRPDGTVRWLREGATPGRDAAGRIAVAGILSDVTDQKEAEASLLQAKQDAEAANRMKSTFLATMSHELRTPLGAIKGFAELLEEEVAALDSPPPEVTEFAQVIRTNATRVLRLVSDLLDLAKLQTDRLTLDRSPVPLAVLARGVASRYESRLAERGVDFLLPPHDAERIALGDPRRLEQVLDILLSNASKFTEEGVIAVSVGGDAQATTLSVSDSGVGIAEEYLSQLFEPFSQEDNRLNRNYEGSGLGLALAHRLTAAMGGEIAVESRKGEGTTFTLRLPSGDS